MAIQKLLFKRGIKAALEAKLIGDNKLLNGEPAYETDTGKIKIGNGTSNYADLPYIGGSSEESIVLKGYYDATYEGGIFWRETTKTNPLPRLSSKIYKDIPTGLFYYLDENVYTLVFDVATPEKYGLIKLYKVSGTNEDGSMTQKAITNSISGIKFAVSEDAGENYLNLEKPW